LVEAHRHIKVTVLMVLPSAGIRAGISRVPSELFVRVGGALAQAEGAIVDTLGNCAVAAGVVVVIGHDGDSRKEDGEGGEHFV
jgi:hypothetical protein